MLDPFASVAENYDVMIDWPARLAHERPFFEMLFKERPVQRVLDVGCGTGHHTRLFAELGAEAYGLDPSHAMLERARALTPGDNPRFLEGGFAEIPSLAEKFDLIVVLGNTLAYAKNLADLTNILRMMRAALAPGGRVCVQVVNYDSVLLAGSRWLPLIHRQADGREYLFLREHRKMGQKVEFTITTLLRDGVWTRGTERSLQFPITGALLYRALLRIGYTKIQLFGSYQQAVYDPTNSPALLALAENG